MSTRDAIDRPRAGARFARPRATVLACLLTLALVGVPTAALAHHHASTVAGDDLSCSLCLWQSHLAAEPATATTLAAPAGAPLAAVPAAVRAVPAAPSVGAPRAPPASLA